MSVTAPLECNSNNGGCDNETTPLSLPRAKNLMARSCGWWSVVAAVLVLCGIHLQVSFRAGIVVQGGAAVHLRIFFFFCLHCTAVCVVFRCIGLWTMTGCCSQQVINVAGQRLRAMALYRQLLRAAKKMPTPNRQNYVIRKTRSEYRANQYLTDPEEIELYLRLADTNLDSVLVQAEHLTKLMSNPNYQID